MKRQKQYVKTIVTVLALPLLCGLTAACNDPGGEDPSAASDLDEELVNAAIVRDSTGGLLSIAENNQNRFSGLYERDDAGIRFIATLEDDINTLYIGTADGQAMIEISDNGNNLDLSIGSDFVQRVSKVDIQRQRSLLRAPDADGAVPSVPELEVENLGNSSAVDGLKSVNEYALLPWLSNALGEAGYTGADYPVLFPVHGIAMTAGQELGISLPPVADPIDAQFYSSEPVDEDDSGMSPRWWPRCKMGSICLLGNCPANNGKCTGMCGPDCECWWPVCADCCAHLGCYVHDLNCGSTFAECALNFWQFFIGGCANISLGGY